MEDLDIAAASTEIGESLGLGESTADTPDEGPELDISEGDVVSAEVEGEKKEKAAAEPATTKKVEPEKAAAVKPETAETPASTTTKPEPRTLAPGTWRQEAAARWKDIDPVIQAEILKREDDVHKGISNYKQAADAWKLTHQAIAPYLPTLQQLRIDPIQQIQGLMDINHRLATGTPEDKIQVLTDMAKRFNVDLAALDPAAQPWVDPQVASLQQTVRDLQSSLRQLEQVPVAQQKQAIAVEVDKFASDPAHVHFDRVYPEMVMLLRADNKISLKEAYDKAVWANPVTRAEELQKVETEKAAQAAKAAVDAKAAAAARTAAARRATGVNVRSSAYSGRSSTPLGSIDDTLAQTLASIQGRK